MIAKRGWSRPAFYNGFDQVTRAATNRPQREALRAGVIEQPLVCCITGFSRPDDPQGAGYQFLHLEDYRRPLDFYPVSKSAHAALHARFRDPERWKRVVHANYVAGAWFTLLSMNPADQAVDFDKLYPEGLPGPGETWTDYAAGLGISREMFAPVQASLI